MGKDGLHLGGNVKKLEQLLIQEMGYSIPEKLGVEVIVAPFLSADRAL